MRFKLSVRELEILDKDRIKILTKLRESHLNKTSKSKQNKSSRKKQPMKPPILLVPLDDSRLFCIIQTCAEYDEVTENKDKEQEEVEKASSVNDCCKKSTQRKQARNGGMNKKITKNTTSITIDDTFCDNQLENNAMKNVPNTHDQIFPANLEVSEVIYFYH